MSPLSIFIDESGDFGAYSPQSPYYIVVLVLHDQKNNITGCISKLNQSIAQYNLPKFTVHTAPLIRREAEYNNFPIEDRRQIFNRFFNFVRACDLKYYPIVIEKRHISITMTLADMLRKQLNLFLDVNYDYFAHFGQINIYYDYGQVDLTHILLNRFSHSFLNVSFRKVKPESYKLFQAADLLCTLTMISKKAEAKSLSKSEIAFFHSERELRKNYLNAIKKKQLS